MAVTFTLITPDSIGQAVTIPDGGRVIVHRSSSGVDVQVLLAVPESVATVPHDRSDSAPAAEQRAAGTVDSPEAAVPPVEEGNRSAFPLTAEQLVRGLGFALAQVINARRHPSEAIHLDSLTLQLGVFMGVPLPTNTIGAVDSLYPHPDQLLPCGSSAGGRNA